jgi:hypothetical protein
LKNGIAPALRWTGMTVRPKAFEGSKLCKRKLYEIMRIAIAHVFTAMTAKAIIPLTAST